MHLCKRCLKGQVIGNQCLQCGAEYDDDGNIQTALKQPKPAYSFTLSEISNEDCIDGEYIKGLRNKLGMTQRQFAAWLGVSKATISSWETGKTHHIPSRRQEYLRELLSSKIGS